MPIITVLIVLAVIGFLLWLVTTYVPMDATIKRILVAVVIIITVLWLLNVFGLLGALGNVNAPRMGRS
jgi:hypothetical protein